MLLLYGLFRLAGGNAYLCLRVGRASHVPECAEVQWFDISGLQCRRAPSGHWFLGAGLLSKVSEVEVIRVGAIRAKEFVV